VPLSAILTTHVNPGEGQGTSGSFAQSRKSGTEFATYCLALNGTGARSVRAWFGPVLAGG
jgi:hypothetical protein